MDKPRSRITADSASTQNGSASSRRPPRWRWIWFLLICLLLTLSWYPLGVVAYDRLEGDYAGCDRAFVPRKQGPCYVLVGYYRAVRARDWDRAYRYMATSLRAQVTREELRDEWMRQPRVRIFHVDQDFTGPENEDVRVFLSGRIGYEWLRYTTTGIEMTRQDGEWKILRFTQLYSQESGNVFGVGN